jgi:hypothetical protein
MHIFIDESGSFGGISEFPSISIIGALIVPDARLANLEKQYKRLRPNLPKDEKGEVKGRLLDESQVDNSVSLLLADSVLFFAGAIDLGTHTEDGLKAFQAQQAEKMTANLNDEHQESLKAQVWAGRKTFEGFKLPLMIQAILTFEFIFDILEFATMYYATRRRNTIARMARADENPPLVKRMRTHLWSMSPLEKQRRRCAATGPRCGEVFWPGSS